MEKETWVIAGLGNPGAAYAHTRHNMGFDVTDILARRLGVSLSRSRCGGLAGECDEDGRRLVICQPQTMMNCSGDCVGPLLHWYKTDTSRLLVVCDDIDLTCGTVRFRASGSPGTHNGLRSVTQAVGQDFARARVGVGAPPPEWDLVRWVLGKALTREEQEILTEACARAADGCLEWFRRGIQSAMARCNGKAAGQTKRNE